MLQASGSPGVDVEKYRSRLEALLYCGKEIPEEKIEKPAGVPAKSLPIGNKPICGRCVAKGAVCCPTCSGSGLYVDSILESQGIIVKVKCLGKDKMTSAIYVFSASTPLQCIWSFLGQVLL